MNKEEALKIASVFHKAINTGDFKPTEAYTKEQLDLALAHIWLDNRHGHYKLMESRKNYLERQEEDKRFMKRMEKLEGAVSNVETATYDIGGAIKAFTKVIRQFNTQSTTLTHVIISLTIFGLIYAIREPLGSLIYKVSLLLFKILRG